ncbi:MAG TPA: ABC transporter permease, partial [Aggregatilineales bacterium]|nr:ABC transporter permease [Aggregatilineales bacterium]
QLILLIVYFVLGYLMFGSLYAIIGSISTNMREGPQLAAFFTIPAVIPLYFLSVIAATPDGALAVGLSLFPITAPLAMVMRLAIQDVPLFQIVLSITLLTLTILFLIWSASRAFRVNILLSGQVPKLKDIPRLIFTRG